MVTQFDLSSYTGGMVLAEDDIIELAISLAKLKLLHDKDESPKQTDKPLNEVELKLIRKILRKYASKDNQHTSYDKLSKRLQEITG